MCTRGHNTRVATALISVVAVDTQDALELCVVQPLSRKVMWFVCILMRFYDSQQIRVDFIRAVEGGGLLTLWVRSASSLRSAIVHVSGSQCATEKTFNLPTWSISLPRRYPSNDSAILPEYSTLFYSQVSRRLKRWRWCSHPKKAILLKSNMKNVLPLSSSWRVPHEIRAFWTDSRFFLKRVSTRQTEEKGSSALKRRLPLHGQLHLHDNDPNYTAHCTSLTFWWITARRFSQLFLLLYYIPNLILVNFLQFQLSRLYQNDSFWIRWSDPNLRDKGSKRFILNVYCTWKIHRQKRKGNAYRISNVFNDMLNTIFFNQFNCINFRTNQRCCPLLTLVTLAVS